jgi:hypothetical protein
MSSDDYAKKQAKRDADYEREYQAWIDSMSLVERREAEKLGLLKPCLQRHGNGAPDRDMAESPAASHTPDIAALVDHEDEQAEVHAMGSATEILRRLVADIVAEDNTRLTIDCLTIALGLRVYSGDSMTKIAKRHGITRAAVSKRCVDITERLKLPPSRAMRSEQARNIYRNSQIKRYRSQKS